MSTVGGVVKEEHAARRRGEAGCRDRSQGEAGREAVWDLTSRLDHRTGGAGSQRVFPLPAGTRGLTERVGCGGVKARKTLLGPCPRRQRER